MSENNQHPKSQYGREFRWKNADWTRPVDIGDDDAFALKLVAVASFPNSWAAYSGPSDWSDGKVATWGYKLLEEQAAAIFPAMARSGRYYRE